MTSPAVYSPSGRIPQRAHGRQRREAMIDAASAILAELGEEGLTLHAVAQRAKSSVGSMYHFFSDKDQLLRAVADRHHEAMMRITAPNRDVASDQWRTMSATDLIGRLFKAPLTYLVAHPDALLVQHLQDADAAGAFHELLVEIMCERVGEKQGPRLASTLYAVSTGTLFHLRELRSTGLMPEGIDISGVLTAYLEHIESNLRTDGD